MDNVALSFKGTEYAGRMGFALHQGNQAKLKKLALTMLVILRQQSRYYHNLSEDKWSEADALERSIKKASATGVTFPLGEQRVKALRDEASEARKELASVGESMCGVMDAWQNAGATFEDLCNFCNRFPDKVKPHLLDGWEKEPFGVLATAYTLDYKDPRGTDWLRDGVDAPIAHALRAYQLDLMLHTEFGRQAAHAAMTQVFPEIVDSMVRIVTDGNGTRHIYDKDGVEIGTVEDDEM